MPGSIPIDFCLDKTPDALSARIGHNIDLECSLPQEFFLNDAKELVNNLIESAMVSVDDVVPVESVKECAPSLEILQEEIPLETSKEDPSKEKEEGETSESEESDSDSSSSSEASDFEFSDSEMKTQKNTKEFIVDDEEDGGPSGPILSKHEAVELPAMVPIDIQLPLDCKMVLIGFLVNQVDSFMVVQACTSGEVQVLDQETPLFFRDRKPLGRVFDTFGPVRQPFYSVRFDPKDSGIVESHKDEEVFYIPDYAKFVLTAPIRAFKGTDASNLYDEELGDDEKEFSDDEQEAEFKKSKKRKSDGPAQSRPRNHLNQHRPMQVQYPPPQYVIPPVYHPQMNNGYQHQPMMYGNSQNQPMNHGYQRQPPTQPLQGMQPQGQPQIQGVNHGYQMPYGSQMYQGYPMPMPFSFPPGYGPQAPQGNIPGYGQAPQGTAPGYGQAPQGNIPGYGQAPQGVPCQNSNWQMDARAQQSAMNLLDYLKTRNPQL